MQQAVRTMLIVLLNIIFFGLAAFGAVRFWQAGYSFGYETVGDTSKDVPPGDTKTFTIDDTDREYDVAVRLAKQDLIGNPYAFYARMQLVKNNGMSMRKGIYTLNSSMTYEQIIKVIYGS